MKVALLFHGDRETRDTIVLDEHRLGPTAAGLREEGLVPEAAVYNDDFADELREQLMKVDAVLVWVNPIEQGRGREKLDATLKEVADAGVFVSAHPDTIMKMGTKQVLYDTREMEWGSDIRVYRTLEELRHGLAARLAEGKPRVLKQFRGHSGHGVWKVTPHPDDPALVLARHAARGSVEEPMSLEALLTAFQPYFAGAGRMIDQEYQPRIAEGMVRAYFVSDRVAGFGHQAINALHPDEPNPGPRLYSPPSDERFQELKRRLEEEWVPDLLRTLGMGVRELPLLWDADLMLGAPEAREERYVLCEINVSSVYPYPESAIRPLARALRARLG